MKGAVAAAAVALLAAGCSLSSAGDNALPVVPPDLPPSPSTWPAYPKFSPRSCWGRPMISGSPKQVAPSFPLLKHKRPLPPRVLVRHLLERFGDRSLIRGVEIGPPPPRRLIRHRFPGKKPPKGGLWAYIDAPRASVEPRAQAGPEAARSYVLARWEANLVGAALRDDFCRAGGPPLVGWHPLDGHVAQGGVSDEGFALNQTFPNPSPAEFRARVVAIGKRFGFQPVSIRLLRPRQLAPIVVVETDRDRREFSADVGEIMTLLDPQSRGRQQTAVTFEGFFFEARDSDGPFARVARSLRGAVVSWQWSALREFSRY
jgi:hypothetical protein